MTAIIRLFDCLLEILRLVTQNEADLERISNRYCIF
jgi:hypothetical protein